MLHTIAPDSHGPLTAPMTRAVEACVHCGFCLSACPTYGEMCIRDRCFHTVLAGYRTVEQAGDAVSAIVASGLLPGAIEFMDALALEAAKAAVHADYPPGCEAVLIVELEGPRETVAIDRERLDLIIAGSAPVEARPARNAAERVAIWKGRKSAFSAVGRLSPDFIVQDGVVPRRRLGDALRRICLLYTSRCV